MVTLVALKQLTNMDNPAFSFEEPTVEKLKSETNTGSSSSSKHVESSSKSKNKIKDQKTKIKKTNDISEVTHQVQDWIRQRLMKIPKPEVPRLSDVLAYAKTLKPRLTKKQISELLRTNVHFHQVMSQNHRTTLESGSGSNLKTGNYRPIITNALGNFHGDIGFFSKSKDYSTPVTFQAGYLVMVDLLSHLVYLEVLKKNRKADAILSALTKIFERHASKHDYAIVSIGFDKERSVISKKVAQFLKQKNIKLTLFSFSRSKAKFAENTIGRVRQIVAVLESQSGNTKRWWRLLPDVESMLNHRPIIVNHRTLSFCPALITKENVSKYISEMQKANPAYYFGQFSINPDLVNFKYKVGDWVKAKTTITSSAVLGEKRSSHHLTDETFTVVHRQAYVRQNLTIGKQYSCKEMHMDDKNLLHSFDEEDLSLYSETPWQ